MQTFIQWLTEVGGSGYGGPGMDGPEEPGMIARMKDDRHKGVGAMQSYDNPYGPEAPPTSVHPFMKKKMKKRQSSL